jgi:two-component system cell cycle sensor histidine kinase/response regulator CckA
MPLGGPFTIETGLADGDEVVAVTGAQASAGRYVRLKLSDTGHGMDAHTRERVFEPFFTTKEFGRGTGLGLATVYGIVQQLGGYVGVSSEVGRGTTFALYYPESRVEAGPIAVGAGRVAAPVATNRKVILVVEDEPSVRILVSRTLKRHGYLVLEASNAAEGLMISERHDGHIDVVLSDVVMPRMDGPEMIRRLREARREVRVLFMSGYTGDAFRHQRGLGTEAHVLEKPFTAHALLEAIQARLDDGSSSSGSAEKRPAQPRLAT